MAYSELIKRFRQTSDGKNVFLSVDSRSIPGNPLYNAFKAKSFTAGDVTFHFYILDLLHDREEYTVQEILDRFHDNYLYCFESDSQPDISTPLAHTTTQPLTTLQKRWLKVLLNDPRIRLFDPPAEGLEDVEPLYPPDAFVYYDCYTDGDPFDDPGYRKRFRCILSAIRHKRWLRVQFTGHNGKLHYWRCIPYKLEYSAKDDKFRLISANKREALPINLARITHCFLMEPYEDADYCPKEMKKRKLVLELTNDRNALERVMLHFSHLDKETERIDGNHYRITLFYEREDETELLIRVLSFGPVLKVIFPDGFIKKLCDRLEKQKRMRTQA